MRFQSPRGTADVTPDQAYRWDRLEQTFRAVSGKYGYVEIRTPTFEETELFARSVGETSDIVTKEMYTFIDKGGRSITLKPEGTAGVMRSVIQHNLCPTGSVARLFYIVPFFRYERPQKGRYREAHQVGLELIGSASPSADAEVIEVTVDFYRSLGLDEVEVSLNSIGRDECRDRFKHTLLTHAAAYLKDQPVENQDRINKNPLRLLDSKDPSAHEALAGLPPITDFLEPEGAARFQTLQETLTRRAVPYRLAPQIVRGLDYYTDTVFEIVSARLGAQNALCGGGRYDKLIGELGGAAVPSVGVGMGIERALIALDDARIKWAAPRPDVFVICVDASATEAGEVLAREIREAGFSALIDPDCRSLRGQLRQADHAFARRALILGPDELAAGVVQVRDLDSSATKSVSRGEILSELRTS